VKAVIVSDSHGRFGGIQDIIEREAPFDVFLHAGDIQGGVGRIEEWAGCPVYVVKGNCDWSGDFPQEIMVPFGSHRIFLTHGHRHAVKIEKETIARVAKNLGADIAVHGHSHIPSADERYGVIILCPGSVSEPRQQNRRPTYIVLETAPGGKVTLEIKYSD